MMAELNVSCVEKTFAAWIFRYDRMMFIVLWIDFCIELE